MARNRTSGGAQRGSDAARMARRMRNQQPEVRQMKAIKRAIKRHQTPPSVSFGLTKPPVGKAF